MRDATMKNMTVSDSCLNGGRRVADNGGEKQNLTAENSPSSSAADDVSNLPPENTRLSQNYPRKQSLTVQQKTST